MNVHPAQAQERRTRSDVDGATVLVGCSLVVGPGKPARLIDKLDREK
jgi:hypothetical protein